MPYRIESRDGKYLVIKEDDGATMGRHDTEIQAKAQLRALHAGERRSARKSDDDGDDGEGLTVFGWESVKAIGDAGEFAGYLWRWGSPNEPDATRFRDYFTKESSFGPYISGEIEGYLHHAMPEMKGKPNPAGDNTIGMGRIALDDQGGWLTAKLNLAVAGVGEVWETMKADDDAYGLSSGAISHLVRRVPQPNGTNWLKKWPVAEWSLTPDPGEKRTSAIALKSLLSDDSPLPEPPESVGFIEALRRAESAIRWATGQPKLNGVKADAIKSLWESLREHRAAHVPPESVKAALAKADQLLSLLRG